ncbi:hypothetical protein Asulf_01185 [Archaeoglobus sulfaticallidus PM70-1]|uniref:Uncharacterized protein n=1 Tax=Archaeoglobus sulfaticallidus PM70-1 TaxID=387631 RepID=N0BC37_9EURY|nr:hypothetical protein [Archaeoglobus sulfaticallidus]AGK61184.1 hypothetical protein Asulf_01185 [Archaeoglobus sulfaticallidus PM70-1]
MAEWLHILEIYVREEEKEEIKKKLEELGLEVAETGICVVRKVNAGGKASHVEAWDSGDNYCGW